MLPLDGVRSIVFQGPSMPSMCIAQGNVWFDHPIAHMSGCLKYATVRSLYVNDLPNPRVANMTILDWKTFDSGDRMCLRLTEYGAHIIMRKAGAFVGSHFEGTTRPSLSSSPVSAYSGMQLYLNDDVQCKWSVWIKLIVYGFLLNNMAQILARLFVVTLPHCTIRTIATLTIITIITIIKTVICASRIELRLLHQYHHQLHYQRQLIAPHLVISNQTLAVAAAVISTIKKATIIMTIVSELH